MEPVSSLVLGEDFSLCSWMPMTSLLAERFLKASIRKAAFFFLERVDKERFFGVLLSGRES